MYMFVNLCAYLQKQTVCDTPSHIHIDIKSKEQQNVIDKGQQ